MYTAVGTYYSFLDDCLLSWLDWDIPIQPGQGFQHVTLPHASTVGSLLPPYLQSYSIVPPSDECHIFTS